MTIDEFNENLLVCETSLQKLEFVQKYLFHGTPFVFGNREAEYFEFRNRIANKFNVGFHEVFIVGSSKLGFSYHKKSTFSYDSDIDIVIVNEKLFEEFYYKITDYQYHLDKSYLNVPLRERNIYTSFLRYLVKGWMRPDKLPTSFQIDTLKAEWFDFFDSISYNRSEVGNYKVAAGLFKNYTYLEKYYIESIEEYYKTLKVL